MANGDAASALGYDIVLPSGAVQDGYDEINKSRDYIANHVTSGTHSAAQITSGVLGADRIPVIQVTKGGTGATTAETARTNLGAAAAADITDLQNQIDALEARIAALET